MIEGITRARVVLLELVEIVAVTCNSSRTWADASVLVADDDVAIGTLLFGLGIRVFDTLGSVFPAFSASNFISVRTFWIAVIRGLSV